MKAVDASGGTKRRVFQNVELSGGIWTDGSFQNSTFHKCSFVESRMENMNLEGTTFRECDLRGIQINQCQWKNAIFENVNMTGAQLSNMNVSQVTMHNVCMKNVKMIQCSFTDADVTDKHPDIGVIEVFFGSSGS